MKPILIVAVIGVLVGSAAAQSPAEKIPPHAPRVPKEAPPGKLCLLQSPARCDQSPPQIIREPFSPGDVDLYMLEKERLKDAPKTLPAPSPHN